MGFSCDGAIFRAFELDYSADNVLLATFAAARDWDVSAQATMTASIAGIKVLEEEFEVCDYLESSAACGVAGTATMDVSTKIIPILARFLPRGSATSAAMQLLITSANIKVTAKPDGTTDEKCTKSTLASSYLPTNPKAKESNSKTAGVLIGMIALIGLAVFGCVFTIHRKRKRNRATSRKSADQKLDSREELA